jgi:radical SAM protein with 4Fe4S-binding SPASM domain
MLVNAKCAPHYIKTVVEQAAGAATDENPADSDVATGTLERGGFRLRQGFGGQVSRASTREGAPSGSSPIRTYSGGAGGCPAGTHYMGIRPNGDVTPCPYLPVFAGNLRNAPLADLWTTSELFADVRRRTSLGGRCGECEMNAHCGGCRARAYGMAGDLMAEDPLCTHTPGRFAGSPLLVVRGAAAGSGRLEASALEYGRDSPVTIAWDDDAAARMKRIPAFVRGMVVKAVEDSCRRNGIARVTIEELERIRARMPTPKLFGQTGSPSG